jgi:hypothetical protein
LFRLTYFSGLELRHSKALSAIVAVHAYICTLATLCIGGGGVAAGVLTAAGLTVAVVEKGGLFGTADYAAMSEMQGFQSLYEKQGLCTSDDGNVIVSVVNCYYYVYTFKVSLSYTLS